MKVGIVFATPDLPFRTFVTNRKEGVLPVSTISKEFGATGGPTFSVSAFPIDTARTADEFAGWLNKLASRLSALIVLIDVRYAHLADGVRDAFFVVGFDSHYPGTNHLNRAGAILAPVLKNFAALLSTFADLKYRKILLLPLDIFRAQDLVDLRHLFTRDGGAPGFGQRLINLLAALRRRQTPKKRASYERTYLVDDAPWYFEYGHEHHARAETGSPPHEVRCRFNSRFRFGVSYEDHQHFNVSDAHPLGTISGTFATCHGPAKAVMPTAYLNIFPNCYF